MSEFLTYGLCGAAFISLTAVCIGVVILCIAFLQDRWSDTKYKGVETSLDMMYKSLLRNTIDSEPQVFTKIDVAVILDNIRNNKYEHYQSIVDNRRKEEPAELIGPDAILTKSVPGLPHAVGTRGKLGARYFDAKGNGVRVFTTDDGLTLVVNEDSLATLGK